MGTCEEYISISDFRSKYCRKPSIGEVNGKHYCKTHLKRAQIRHGVDTGEQLETRFFVANSTSIYEVQGTVGKKQFTVRKKKLLMGNKDYDYTINISLDSQYLHTTLDSAKKFAIKWVKERIEDEEKELTKKHEYLKKLQQEKP